MADAGPAVDRAEHRKRLVGGRPAVLPGDAIEPVLYILAGDGIQGPLQLVREIDPQVLAVEPHGGAIPESW